MKQQKEEEMAVAIEFQTRKSKGSKTRSSTTNKDQIEELLDSQKRQLISESKDSGRKIPERESYEFNTGLKPK